MFEQRTKLATADAITQMRNEFSRALAKESQKLWDSNVADTKKLKEAHTAQIATLEQNIKDMGEFQIQSAHALEGAAEGRDEDCLIALHKALAAYKSGKSRNLIDMRSGARTVRHVFEFLGKKFGEGAGEKAREELTNPLYEGLEEELAIAALQSPWLAPLINERIPTPPEVPTAETGGAQQAAQAVPRIPHADSDTAFDEEYDSCRLISS
jgi:hypothetical protein